MSPATKWTLAIVSLLGGTVAACVVLIVLASGSGRSRVLPDYYARAADYSASVAAAAKSNQAGWIVTPTLRDGRLQVCIADKGGTPVQADVVAEGYLRLEPTKSLRATLSPTSVPGCYDAPLSDARGLFEMVITATSAAQTYTGTASLEQNG